MSESFPSGKFVWYDLMTKDPDGAKSFYTSLIGWGLTHFEGGEKPYEMWTNGEKPIGGVMQLPAEAEEAGAPTHWISYVAVEDTEAALARATDLGATVLVPGTEIDTVGRFGIFSDPQGAVLAVYTPAGEMPAGGGPPKPGEVSWHELMTTDSEAAFDFYSKMFGWQATEDLDMGEAGTYLIYGRGDGKPLGGMFNRPAEMPVSAWLYYLRVPDVHTAVEKVKELGGQVLNGPMEVPGGTFVAQCMDPQGGAFALHSAAADKKG